METLFTELRQVFQDEYIHLGKHLSVGSLQAAWTKHYNLTGCL